MAFVLKSTEKCEILMNKINGNLSTLKLFLKSMPVKKFEKILHSGLND